MTALPIPIALSIAWVPCGIISLGLMARWGGWSPPPLALLFRFLIALLGPIGLLLLGLAWVAVGRDAE